MASISYTQEQRDLTVRMVASGASYAEAAEAVGATKQSVQKWCRKAGVKPGVNAPPEAYPEAPPAEASSASPADPLKQLQEAIAENQRMFSLARQDGNWTVAQRALAEIGKLTNTLARLQVARGHDVDAVVIPRDQVDETMRSTEQILRAIADRPLLCAECSRALSIQWGGRDPNGYGGD